MVWATGRGERGGWEGFMWPEGRWGEAKSGHERQKGGHQAREGGGRGEKALAERERQGW